MGGAKLEKRYSPSFRDDSYRKQSAPKRKRDDVLRLVTFAYFLYFFYNKLKKSKFFIFIFNNFNYNISPTI